VRAEIIVSLIRKAAVFWDVAPCILVQRQQRHIGTPLYIPHTFILHAKQVISSESIKLQFIVK
jgi:hypothetical protein